MEHASVAIGVMTMWLTREDEDNGRYVEYVNQVVGHGNSEQISALISGLVAVAGHLLIREAQATSRDELSILQDLGRIYATE